MRYYGLRHTALHGETLSQLEKTKWYFIVHCTMSVVEYCYLVKQGNYMVKH